MKLLIVYPEDDLHSFIALSIQKNGFYHNKNKEPRIRGVISSKGERETAVPF